MHRSVLLVTLCALLTLPLVACQPAAPAPAAPAPTATNAAATAAPPAAPTSVPPTVAPTSEPPATPVPLSSPIEPDSCLVGEWQVADMAGYVLSILPIELLVEDSRIELVSTSGSLSYVFSGDSSVTMMADAYTFNYNLVIEGAPPLPMQVILDGASLGHFSTAGDGLTLAEGAPDDLSITILVSGQTVAGDTTRLAESMPMGTTAPMTYSYACEGDVLKITPPVPNALPITLKRVQR